ncbi:MAG: hypothetical protein ACREK9_13280 [Candidatus Rokuibacteriota bacterium]
MLRVFVPALLALAVLSIAGVAAAHVGSPPPVLPATDAATIIPILSAGPSPLAVPWYLPAALALGVVAARRRPRRALVIVTLALLLCVFSFEDALHSVHHGFDVQQQEQCIVAAASAQLSAVPVDGIALCSVALPIIGEADPAPPAFALTRFLSPDQGRAPPSAIR